MNLPTSMMQADVSSTVLYIYQLHGIASHENLKSHKNLKILYWDADKSLARKRVRDTRNFNKIEMRAVIKFLFPQSKAPKEIHAIVTETLACFLRGRAKDLSAPP